MAVATLPSHGSQIAGIKIKINSFPLMSSDSNLQHVAIGRQKNGVPDKNS